MSEHFRYIWQLLILSSLLVLSGILVITYVPVEFPVRDYLIMTGVMTCINLAAYFLMIHGIVKMNREGAVILLGGIGLKFILYLIFILVYWGVTKNLTKPFIIAFFLLYLIFTILMIRFFYKILRAR